MAVTVPEMIDLLEAALDEAKAKRLRQRDPGIILLGRRVVLGQAGRLVGDKDGVPGYAFTVGQCRAMLDEIADAVQEVVERARQG